MNNDFQHYPAGPVALKMAVAVGIGTLIGMERKWAHKGAGIRTFFDHRFARRAIGGHQPRNNGRFDDRPFFVDRGDERPQPAQGRSTEGHDPKAHTTA